MSEAFWHPPGMRAPTKARIGFSLAIVALLALSGGVAVNFAGWSHGRASGSCLVVAAAGVVLWIVSGAVLARRGDGRLLEGAVAEHPLSWFKRPDQWGLVLALSAMLVYSYQLYRNKPRHLPPTSPPVVRASPLPRTPVVFPPLKLEGIVYSRAHSSVLINGEVLCVGDGIGRVRVTAIAAGSVTLELDGETKVLLMPR
jgi:hypothetical protein